MPRRLTYPFAPGTVLGQEVLPGFRRFARRSVVGDGRADFDRAAAAALEWALQRRSGIRVTTPDGAEAPRASVGQDVVVGIRIVRVLSLELRVLAPARVVAVVAEERAARFVYGTLPSHPERGEEAFLVRHRDDDRVEVEIRALARGAMPWRLTGSVLRLFQAVCTARYLRALR